MRHAQRASTLLSTQNLPLMQQNAELLPPSKAAQGRTTPTLSRSRPGANFPYPAPTPPSSPRRQASAVHRLLCYTSAPQPRRAGSRAIAHMQLHGDMCLTRHPRGLRVIKPYTGERLIAQCHLQRCAQAGTASELLQKQGRQRHNTGVHLTDGQHLADIHAGQTLPGRDSWHHG